MVGTFEDEEFNYKAALFSRMESFLEAVTIGDNDLGYINNELAKNMTEAAYLILKQNKQIQQFLEEQGAII